MKETVKTVEIEKIKTIINHRLSNWLDRISDFKMEGCYVTFRTGCLTDTLLESLFGGYCEYSFIAKPVVSLDGFYLDVQFDVFVTLLTSIPAR